MAWSFFCPEEGVNFTAGSKDELADMVQQHMRQSHNQDISRTQAMDMVNSDARQMSE